MKNNALKIACILALALLWGESAGQENGSDLDSLKGLLKPATATATVESPDAAGDKPDHRGQLDPGRTYDEARTMLDDVVTGLRNRGFHPGRWEESYQETLESLKETLAAAEAAGPEKTAGPGPEPAEQPAVPASKRVVRNGSDQEAPEATKPDRTTVPGAHAPLKNGEPIARDSASQPSVEPPKPSSDSQLRAVPVVQRDAAITARSLLQRAISDLDAVAADGSGGGKAERLANAKRSIAAALAALEE